jgi:cell cycle serine/threonine-protein kinase CDC5/MSD2
VSTQVRELVQATLTPDPEARPALHEILDDVWFTHGTVPAYIPASAHDEAPDFRHLSRAASQANLARLRRNSFLDADQVATLDGPLVDPTPASSAAATIGSSVPPTGRLKTATSSLAQQEKEFHHAVQPGSPISALLKSARQPLVVAPSPKPTGETPLLRKLQAAQKERHARDAATAPAPADAQRLQQVEEDEDVEDEAPRAGASKGRRERDAEQSRKKELELQKARIVAQMVPAPLAPGDDGARLFGSNADGVAVAPIRRATAGAAVPSPDPGAEEPVLRANTFDSVALTLTAAFEARAAGRPYRDPRDRDDLPDERVFIVSWVDYCNKYGMGYALTDGSVGVHFNDSTTLVLAPDKQ